MWIRFSRSAQGSVDSTSASTLDSQQWADRLEQCAWWRGKPSAARSWAKRLKKGGWTTRLCGSEICATYPLTNCRTSTGTQGDTPASLSARQGNGWEKTTRVICGPSSSDNSNLFDLKVSSSRMSPATCLSASIASFKTWRDAVSAARSDCLQRRKSAHLTDGSASSSSAWPTPTGIHASRGNHDEDLENYERRVQDYKDGKAKGKPGKSLGVAVRMWPTPTQKNDPRHTTKTGVSHSGTSLIDAVRIWPTPRASTGGADQREKTGLNLAGVVRLWPTATTRDWKGTYVTLVRKDGKKRGDLLPDAVNIEEGGAKLSISQTAPETSKEESASAPAGSTTSSAEAQVRPRTESSTQRSEESSTVDPSKAGPPDQENSKRTGSRPGPLNPTWVETLMGLPSGWTAASVWTESID